MSADKLKAEAARWLRQAKDDLDAAEHLARAAKYAQAGFYAQQAAEKAVKAATIAIDGDPWGHSVTKLIDELPADVNARFAALRSEAIGLDRLYIPTRYPDALPDLIPGEAFTSADATRALAAAKEIIATASVFLDEGRDP